MSTEDDHIKAEARAIPIVMKSKKQALSGATVSLIDIGYGVKSVSLFSTTPIEFNVSVGASAPGDLITTGTDDRVMMHPGGGYSIYTQETEFDRIYFKIEAETGTDTVHAIFGKGLE